jgi:hypothetical protein
MQSTGRVHSLLDYPYPWDSSLYYSRGSSSLEREFGKNQLFRHSRSHGTVETYYMSRIPLVLGAQYTYRLVPGASRRKQQCLPRKHKQRQKLG